MKRSIVVAAAVVVAVLGPAVPALAKVVQVPVVRLTAETEVAAPPAAVWAHLTSGKNLVTWCPVWKGVRNASVTIAKVGDVLDYMDEWGHGGRSIVTYLDAHKELRVAHEPNDGSYMCQARIVLTPSAHGTTVRYVEQYTDESAPQELQATAEKMQGETQGMLAALKKAVEKK